MATWQDLVRLSKEEKKTAREEESKKNPTIVDPKNTRGLTWKDLVRASRAGDEVQNVDENYINSFITDSNNFFTTSQTDYGTVGWGNAKELAQQRYTDVNNLDRRYWAIGRWAEANRDKLTEDGYNQIIGILNNYKSGKGNVLKAYNDAVVHYSQWDSEEAYNTDKQNYEWSQKYQGKSASDLQNIALGLDDGAEKKWVNGYAAYMDEEEKAAYDLEAGQAEIDAMEAKLAELRRQRNAGYGTNNTHTGLTYGASQQGNEDIDKQIKDLEAQIAAKKAYLNQAKQVQTARAGDAVAGNEDFSQYSGYESTINPDPEWGQPVAVDETYEWINNQNGYREQYEAEYDRTHRTKSGDTSTGYGAIRQTGYDVAVTESEYEKKGYDYLTEDEIAIYNYYYKKVGKEKAQQYLDSIQERLNQRKGAAIFKSMEGNTAQEIVFGIATGLDQFGTSLDSAFNFKDEYIPYSALQFTSGMIREDLADDGKQLPSWLGGGSLAQAAYDAVNTSANMAPSILAATVANAFVPGAGSWLGSALMGASAAGSAYQQALHDGYSKKEARIYSTLIGATELVMEKFLSGITEFGGNAAGKFFVRNMNAADNALKMIARQVLGGMASEFTEEYLQEVIEPVIQNLVFNTNHDVKLISSDALYAGFLGALTAFGPELTNSGITAIKYTSAGKNLVASGVTAKDLADVGSKFAADTVAYKLAGQIDENTNAFTMGRMFYEIGAQLTEQNVSAIAEALEVASQGIMPKKIARKNAEILAYIVEGGKVPYFLMKTIVENDVLAKVMREVIIDPNSTVYQRSVGYRDVLRKLAGETVEARTVGGSKANGDSEVSVAAQKENGSENRSEGGTGDRKAIGIVSVKKGNPVVKLDDGSEVSLQDADLSPDDALIIKTVTDIDGISAQDAGDIFKILKAVDSDPAASSLGAMEAYRYGYYGFSEKHLADNAIFAKKLTEIQRKAIYEIGKKARDTSVAAETENIKQKRSAAEGTKKEPAKLHITYDQGRGRVRDLQTGSIKGLNRKQKAAVAIAKVLQGLGVGTDFEFFSSYLSKTKKDEEGNRVRVFLDANGNEVVAYSGVYRTGDGKIRIDLNAYSGRGLALNAMSHELVHFIKQWSPEKYRTMAELVSGAYEKTTMSMDQRVRREQNRLNGIRKEDVSYDEAYDEVVANALNRMLDDGTVVDRVAEIRKTDRDLADKMIECIRNFAKKLASIFANNESLFYDTYDLMQFKETVDEIRNLFAEALVEASDNRLSSIEAGEKKLHRDYARHSSQETDLDTETDSIYDGVKRETEQEVIPYGQKGKPEDYASFLRRMHSSARRIHQVGNIAYAFHKLRVLDASNAATEARKELQRLGIKCILHNGLEYNYDGFTYQDQGNASALADGSVAVFGKSFGDGIEFAGHEAFHVWGKSADRVAYVETLKKNINIISSVYGIEQANTVLREYFGGNVEALASKGAKAQFLEELYALVSGKIHSGASEAGLKTMFKDYDAVKAAWDELVETQTSQKGQRYSSQETDADYMDVVNRGDMKTAQRMVDDAAKAAGFFVRGFHGSSEKFNVFSYGHIGASTGVGILGEGFYFGDDKALAKMYGPQMYDSYLRMGNTYHATEKDQYKINTAKLAEQGYDSVDMVIGGGSGKIYCVFDNTQIKSAAPVTYDDNGNVIPLSQRFDSSNPDIRYSTQETDNITARDLLSGTDVATVKNEVTKKKLAGYQKTLEVMTAEEQKLREIRAEIKELSFDKGTRDTKKLKDLKSEAAKISNHLSVYEGQLQRMEKELQSVVKRERAKVVKEAEKRDKAVLAKEWMAAEVKQSETLRDLRETRAALRQQESDTAVMEKEFIRITKEYEKQDAERGKTISNLRKKLKNEAEKHRADNKMWMSEFGRLMREYDAAGRNIDRLEQKIERQKAVAKERVESRGRTAVRHKIQNVVDELNRLLLTDSKKHRVPDSLKKAVAEALDLVNMDTIGAEERAAKYEALIAKERAKANPDQDKIDAYTVSMENILRKGEKMGQKLNDLHAAYEKIQNSDDPDIANAYDPVIAGAISELAETIGNTSLKDMTIDQLNDVYDVYKMVLIRVRDANKALAENIAKSIEELAKSTISEVQAVGGAKKYRAAVMDPVRKFDWNNMKPVYAMERIGSDTLIEVFNNVRAGEDTWARDVSEARAYYLDKVKKYGYNKWDFDKKYRFESASGIAFDLTLEQIMSLYAYSRREQAIDHLRLGGFVFDNNIETVKEKGKLVKYKVNTADAHQITPEIMADIVGKLSKEQIGFVEDMQDYLSTVMGAKGNEVTSKMYGVKLFKEKFYFPLKSAKQFMFEQNEVAGEVKIKNSGFTNKVVAKANNPVVLSNFMDVWAGHVNDMSMYHAFTLPLEDFNRVFNYNTPKRDGVEPVSVKGTIQNAYSPAAVQYIKQLITDLNGGARTDSTTGFINKMMGLFKKGSVFASLSVVVQQPSAVARAAALIDAKYFIGPKLDQKRHDALWEEVKKYAPVALIKEMGYFDTNMGKSTLDYITGREYSGFSEKMKALVTDSNYRDEVLSKAPALADEMAWCSIWEAVKRETKANHPGMDVKSDAFLKLAGARFTEVITKTQVYDSVLARSANMRSKDTGMKMATAFMAEPTTSINMIEDALFKAKRGGAAGKRYCRRAIGAVIASQILNSILVSFVYAARDDDEDETYWEKYIGALTGGIMDGLNPATYIPFIKDIMSIVQGYDVERSDMSVVSDMWKAWQNLGKDNVSTYRKVEGFVGSIAQIFGLPVKNIMRDARGIYNAIMTITGADKATGAGIKYAIEEAWTGKSVPDKVQLYEARMAGDTEHAARVEARYDDAESANAAVRAAIKDSFMAGEIDESTALKHMVLYAGMDADEAYWLMDSWKYRKAVGSDDGYGKYSNLYDAVRTGTDLEGVIKTYTDNGIKPSTLTSQITEEFKPEYVKLTPKERSAMRGKLVDAFVLCGMEREDAEEKLDSWDFEAEHGFAYSDRREAYENGEVSRSELVAILVDRGYSPEDANAQIDSYEWEAEGYEDVTYAAIRNYNTYCAPVGISKAVYVSFWEFEKDTENDVNEATGKPIAYSAVRKIMAYINSLNLTPAQKDALAKSAGWKDSTIKKYKLW